MESRIAIENGKRRASVDMAKIGQFIAALRKSRGLTQQEVADRLGITDKTVSKWECGNGLPDISVIPAIAEMFEVTADEILRGERITETKHTEQSQKKTVEQAEFFIENKCRRIKGLLFIVLGGAIFSLVILYSLLNITSSGQISCGVSLLFCVIGGVTLLYAFSKINELEQDKTAMRYQEDTAVSFRKDLARLLRTDIFLVLFATALNISLFLYATRNGSILSHMERNNPVHFFIALIIACTGVFVFSRSNKNRQ